jgi:alpha-tubulin suppressor-like RCC1 family protein
MPAPNGGFIAIEAGSLHSVGIRADGTIMVWGGNTSGQCNVLNRPGFSGDLVT